MSSLETNVNRNVRTSLDLHCRTNCSKAFVWSKQLTLLLIILSRRTIKRYPLRCIRNVLFVASIKFLSKLRINAEVHNYGNAVNCKTFHQKGVKTIHDKRDIKPNADGRNIFGQQLPTLFELHVANVFTTFCPLLHVVACCWELLAKF